MHRAQAKLILQALWRRLNETAFGGSLRREPRFHVFESTRKAGWFSPGGSRDSIGVNSACIVGQPLSELVDTMAHEMCHQAQSENGLELNHGPFFQILAAKVGVSHPS